jgi:hypothetical protein
MRNERLITNALWLYVLVIFFSRMTPNFFPYVAETDWKQWIWQYHRYARDGAFPPGQLLTDYGFAMQPPLYWLVMATLSSVLHPQWAAAIVNIVAIAGAFYFVARIVEARTSPLFAAAAAALLARDEVFHRVTVGGYPRTFGPVLTLAFLAFWLEGRHRAVLLTFVVGAALYPSVVVPCALVYGAWSVLVAGRAGWWRRNLELAACAVVVAALSLVQNFEAPDWWGHVLTLAEAEHRPELGPDGRFPWLPFPSFWPRVLTSVGQPFALRGFLGRKLHVYPWSSHAVAGAFVVVLAVLVVVAVVLWRRKKTQQLVPLHPLFLVGSATVAFWLARTLAFRLYLPHRMVQHVVPYAIVVVFVIAAFVVGRALLGERRGAVAALVLVLSPFVVAGDGFYGGGWRSYAADKPLYQWLEKHTPITAQFAGPLQILDEIPFFARRQAYVNWKMAHPVRAGYFAEMERRMLAMYGAYYANDLNDVVAFCDQEKIDWFIVDRTRFAAVEQGDGQLFEPVRGKVVAMFEAKKAQGFAMASLPKDVVAFHHGNYDVVDVAKLRAFVSARAPTSAPSPSPSP